MKKVFVTAWLTILCFLLLANVHAWEVPTYVRMNGGARMWFTTLQGDLLQPDRTKVDLVDNVGIPKDKLVWEFFGSARFWNIHVFRFRAEPLTSYEARNDSFFKIRNFRAGYDLDFFMSPQLLFGANADVSVTEFDTDIQNIPVGGNVYTYHDNQTLTTPLLGLHGTFYPILDDIALRPNISSRVNWWNYADRENWEWEVAGGVDVPINKLWTWTVSGGYRFWHTKFKRERDTLDVNRMGFFIDAALLF
ncbi:MAG TPA: hypothetical protein VK463_20505 [Desulfomonilaceae bacterium]|nr:hypothetical protein [Desulfomonilaceae bacterium]